jgi:hypothetical protein
MIPEITIKISFAGEVKEVSAGATDISAGGIEIAPPEMPTESSVDTIPPPPTLEDAVSTMSEAGIIPPPPPIAAEAEIAPPPPEK